MPEMLSRVLTLVYSVRSLVEVADLVSVKLVLLDLLTVLAVTR